MPRGCRRFLIAAAAYPSWNPFIMSLKGTLAGDGRTRFLHSERFTGLLVGPLMSATLDRTALGFTEMNQALKIQSDKRR